MRVNVEYLKELLSERGWSQNKFALKAGVSRATVCRVIKGSRGAGKNMINGMIKVFPDEPISKLFFLH